MNDYSNNENYIGRHVKIKSSDKTMYNKIIGKSGIVTKQSGGSIGVAIDGHFNKASSYGVYWFEKSELKFLKDESEDINMGNFEYVAIVNLLEDYNKRDYAFALYKDDFEIIQNMQRNAHRLVVVNARAKDNRILGTIKKIYSAEEYFDENKNVKITAEVVGVVNMDRYIMGEEERVRLAEIAKKRAALEKELEAEINKRKSIEYYEEMAMRYSENPKLAELVAELRSLGV